MNRFSDLEGRLYPEFFDLFEGLIEGALACVDGGRSDRLRLQGDGLLASFDDAVSACRFVWALLERVAGVDWVKLGLAPRTSLRCGLHHDRLWERESRFEHGDREIGPGLTFVTRLGALARPGRAFASEAFAKALGSHDPVFVCRNLGRRSYPKGFGRYPVYRLDRR